MGAVCLALPLRERAAGALSETETHDPTPTAGRVRGQPAAQESWFAFWEGLERPLTRPRSAATLSRKGEGQDKSSRHHPPSGGTLPACRSYTRYVPSAPLPNPNFT
jgi:hypothetical protein